MFLCDGDCGEGLNLLLVCGWGARVLKLIEELKDKKEQWPEGAGFPVGGGAWCPHLPSSAGLQTSKTHQATKPLGCLGRTALVQATVLLEQQASFTRRGKEDRPLRCPTPEGRMLQWPSVLQSLIGLASRPPPPRC